MILCSRSSKVAELSPVEMKNQNQFSFCFRLHTSPVSGVGSGSGECGSTQNKASCFLDVFEGVASGDGFREAIQVVCIVLQYGAIHMQGVHVKCLSVQWCFTVKVVNGVWRVCGVETHVTIPRSRSPESGSGMGPGQTGVRVFNPQLTMTGAKSDIFNPFFTVGGAGSIAEIADFIHVNP